MRLSEYFGLRFTILIRQPCIITVSLWVLCFLFESALKKAVRLSSGAGGAARGACCRHTGAQAVHLG